MSTYAATPHSPALQKPLLAWQKNIPYLMDLLVVEAPGKIVHWTGPGVPPNVADRQYVARHLNNATPRLYIGEPQLPKVHQGKWFFAISKPTRNTASKREQILVAIIDLDALKSSLEVNFSLPNSTLARVSRSGLVYTRMPDHARHVGKPCSCRPRPT